MKTKRPTQLRSPKDVQDWNEYIANEGADGRMSPVILNGMSKVIESAIKINIKYPMEYVKIIARTGKDGLAVSVPWLEQTIKRVKPEIEETAG